MMMILHYHSLSLFSSLAVVVVVVVLPSSSSSFAFLGDVGGIGFGGTIIGFGGVVFLEHNRRRQLSRQRVLAAAAARHISTTKVGAYVYAFVQRERETDKATERVSNVFSSTTV